MPEEPKDLRPLVEVRLFRSGRSLGAGSAAGRWIGYLRCVQRTPRLRCSWFILGPRFSRWDPATFEARRLRTTLLSADPTSVFNWSAVQFSGSWAPRGSSVVGWSDCQFPPWPTFVGPHAAGMLRHNVRVEICQRWERHSTMRATFGARFFPCHFKLLLRPSCSFASAGKPCHPGVIILLHVCGLDVWHWAPIRKTELRNRHQQCMLSYLAPEISVWNSRYLRGCTNGRRESVR